MDERLSEISDALLAKEQYDLESQIESLTDRWEGRYKDLTARELAAYDAVLGQAAVRTEPAAPGLSPREAVLGFCLGVILAAM